MQLIIIKAIFMYLFIATIILINLLFNQNLTLGRLNTKTGELTPSPNWFKMLFSFYWIIAIPIILINRIKYIDKED